MLEAWRSKVFRSFERWSRKENFTADGHSASGWGAGIPTAAGVRSEIERACEIRDCAVRTSTRCPPVLLALNQAATLLQLSL